MKKIKYGNIRELQIFRDKETNKIVFFQHEIVRKSGVPLKHSGINSGMLI